MGIQAKPIRKPRPPGYSHTKEGWVFGYKLHLTSTTTADVGKM
ncbi:MAG: hypothetical protein ABJB76_11575 [Candidatus Nitrosocosmicus sp.]